MENILTFHYPAVKGYKRVTVVGLMSEDQSKISIGVSVCSPKDNFQRKLGREIALGRARKPKSVYSVLSMEGVQTPKKAFYDYAFELASSLSV